MLLLPDSPQKSVGFFTGKFACVNTVIMNGLAPHGGLHLTGSISPDAYGIRVSPGMARADEDLAFSVPTMEYRSRQKTARHWIVCVDRKPLRLDANMECAVAIRWSAERLSVRWFNVVNAPSFGATAAHAGQLAEIARGG